MDRDVFVINIGLQKSRSETRRNKLPDTGVFFLLFSACGEIINVLP